MTAYLLCRCPYCGARFTAGLRWENGYHRGGDTSPGAWVPMGDARLEADQCPACNTKNCPLETR